MLYPPPSQLTLAFIDLDHQHVDAIRSSLASVSKSVDCARVNSHQFAAVRAVSRADPHLRPHPHRCPHVQSGAQL